MNQLIIATGNRHKVEEYRSIFGQLSLSDLSAYSPMDEVIEDASDFVGNAIIKAKAVFQHTGQASLADDSGLEVEALNNRPGVRSARYAPGSDADRYGALLNEMEGVTNRRARFVCAIAVCGLPGDVDTDLRRLDGCIVATGFLTGRIGHSPRGQQGFGYDPIFELDDGRFVAELSSQEKHAISHRGHAARQLSSLVEKHFSTTF